MKKTFIKQKQVLVILVTILLTAFVVNGINHHNRMGHGRNDHRMEMRHDRMQNDVKCDKGTTAYVEVGRLLKPHEVANLLVNQTL